MNNIDLIDETFDIHLTHSYDISIQVSPDGFSFCVLDPIRNKFIALKHFSVDKNIPEEKYCSLISSTIESEEILNKHYKNVLFIYSTTKSTLVPYSLFDKKSISTFFEFNHTLEKEEDIQYNKLKNADAVNLFSIPFRFLETIIINYPNAKIYHQGTSFIENILISNKHKMTKQKVYVHVNSTSFDVVATQGSSLQLYNTFKYNSEDDFLYFVLYVFEQLKLHPEEAELIFSGEIKKDDVNYQKIKKYIRNIRFEKLNEYFSYSYALLDVPSHFYTNLYNINLCV